MHESANADTEIIGYRNLYSADMHESANADTEIIGIGIC